MPRLVAFGECGLPERYLHEQGFEVLRAPGRSRALGLARDLLPELILVGAGADPAVAVDIVRLLADDTVVQLLPVLLVLAGHNTPLLKLGLDAGASDVVSQEMERDEVLARANAAVRSKCLVENLIAEKQRLTLLELAGAVAHKINQPLTSMSIIVETLRASQARADLSADRLERKLADLQGQVDRMATIVKQVANLVDYRTVNYVGDVRIIDLDRSEKP